MYNNFKLFIWNNPNIHLTNKDHRYNNIILHTGSVIQGQWENTVCFTQINNELKVIAQSNMFIIGRQWEDWYNSRYKIFDNIVNNYHEVLSYINNDNKHNIIELDNSKTYFYMINAFVFSNSGHSLSNLLNQTNYIINNNIKDILILKGSKNTHGFKLMDQILPSDCTFYELDISQIYLIQNIIIIPDLSLHIYAHVHLIEKLKNIIIQDYYNIYKDCINKNIILMKTNRNKNILLESTRINCEEFLQNLEQKGYIYLCPEEEDIFKVCIYLLYANKIVFSTGAIYYTNQIFFNHLAKHIFITQNDGERILPSPTKSNIKPTLFIKYDKDNYLNIIEQIDNY